MGGNDASKNWEVSLPWGTNTLLEPTDNWANEAFSFQPLTDLTAPPLWEDYAAKMKEEGRCLKCTKLLPVSWAGLGECVECAE